MPVYTLIEIRRNPLCGLLDLHIVFRNNEKHKKDRKKRDRIWDVAQGRVPAYNVQGPEFHP
jgi:hypothetical protein